MVGAENCGRGAVYKSMQYEQYKRYHGLVNRAPTTVFYHNASAGALEQAANQRADHYSQNQEKPLEKLLQLRIDASEKEHIE